MIEYQGVAYTPEQYEKFHTFLKTRDSINYFLFDKSIDDTVRDDLYKSFPKGTITAHKALIREMVGEARNELAKLTDSIQDALDNECFMTVEGLRADAGEDLWSYAIKLLADFYREELENIYLNN